MSEKKFVLPNSLGWLVVLACIVFVMFFDFIVVGVSGLVRTLSALAVIGIGVVFFALTSQGKQFFQLAASLKQEFYHITWAKRNEILQTFVAITIFVIISLLFILLFDWIFNSIITFFVFL